MMTPMTQRSPIDPRNAAIHLPFGVAILITVASVPFAIRGGVTGWLGLIGVILACVIIGTTVVRAHRKLAKTDYWCADCRLRPAATDADICDRCGD